MFPKSSRRGFTLIELLIVVLIIGILASIILANFGPAKQRARDARRISDISQIQVALEGYFENASNAVPGNNGRSYPPFPLSANGLVSGQVQGAGGGIPSLPCIPFSIGSPAAGGINCLTVPVGNSNVSYLPSVPADPQTNVSYDYYSCDPNGPNKSSCVNSDTGAYYQHYCVGAHLEIASSQSTAVSAANASCSGVTWCDILQNPSHYNSGQDNYVVCH